MPEIERFLNPPKPLTKEDEVRLRDDFERIAEADRKAQAKKKKGK